MMSKFNSFKIQLFRYSIFLFFVTSCGNDFLNDAPTFFGEGTPIGISSEWEEQDYATYCESAGNAKFTIHHTPAWLKVSTQSGQFIDGVAILTCKAKANKDFSEVGIYHALITLSVEGKGRLAIPVVYILEGNPVIETASTVGYNISPNGRVSVKNTGNGILLCSVSAISEWFLLCDNHGNIFSIEEYPIIILPTNGVETIYLGWNPTRPPSQENLSGTIVITTNDKDKPEVEVKLQMNLGNPSLYCDFNQMDFGQTETVRKFGFINFGDGLLVWKIEECPEWLTVSESEGVIIPYSGEELTFACTRELLQPGINTATIYLKTNDRMRPSFSITVVVHKD